MDSRSRQSAAVSLGFRRPLGFLLAAVLVLAALTTAGAAPALRASNTASPVVQAAGRGNPWVNLTDGTTLAAAYAGPRALSDTLNAGDARPLSLAAADFDEDGMPDLVAGYAGESGIVTLHRGNVAALFPYAPEALRLRAEGRLSDAPFHTIAAVFAAPVAPDFLAAGDFDNDGHVDVVMASREDAALFWLPGDGGGGFGEAQHMALPGQVTALAAGEINRRDGLTDLVLGIASPSPNQESLGGAVLVLEGPEGALRAEPETFVTSGPVTGLAVGQVDDSFAMDLAVAAGCEVLIIHGRDRGPAEDPAARVDRFILSYRVSALALGDFVPEETDYRLELAALGDDGALHLLNPQTAQELAQIAAGALGAATDAGGEEPRGDSRKDQTSHSPQLVVANVSSIPVDNLLIVDPGAGRVEIVVPAEQVRERPDDDAWLLAAKPWSTSLDVASSPVALLPMRLNADALSDLVILAESPTELAVALTAPMDVYVVNSTTSEYDGNLADGLCDTGSYDKGFTGICTFTAAMQSANRRAGADAIHFAIGSGPKTIPETLLSFATDAVTINGQTQPGFSGAPIITLQGFGLSLEGGNNAVRGLVINQAAGINLGFNKKGNNIAEGNYLGTHAGGATAPGNEALGIRSAAPNTIIGGTAGTTPGGACTGACNLVSGNSYGIVLTDYIGMSTATGNRVEGNVVGATVSGTAALGNQVGVFCSKDSVVNNTIGGATPAARNLISGNQSEGIILQMGASNNLVQGNWIGVAAGGLSSLGNGAGVSLTTVNATTVGGTAAGAGNVVSANRGDGIRIMQSGSTGNLIQGNLIGVGANGSGLLGNSGVGVYLFNGSGNTIGSASPAVAQGADLIPAALGSGNVIAGSGSHGVEIWGASATLNTVRGNFIGVEQDGHTARGNGGSGVYIRESASNNTIGGTDGLTAGACTGSCNIIANSGVNGVTVVGGNSNAILGNSIHHNTGLGIDLGADGWTRNGTTGGLAPNNWQSYPALTAIAPLGSSTVISGQIRSTANATFRIELFAGGPCDANGLSQGESYVWSMNIQTDATGQKTFVVTAPQLLARVTATATRLAEGGKPTDTSEFSPPDLQVTAIEVTQVIQDLAQTVPLIAGKPTTARVYVQAVGCDVSQVTGELRGPLGGLRAVNETFTAHTLAEPKRPTTGERSDFSSSLNFNLPAGWSDAGTRNWTAEINPQCARPDSDCGDANLAPVTGVTFQSGGTLTLVLTPIRYTRGSADLTPAESEFKKYVSQFRVYPLAMNPFNYYIHAPVYFSGDLRTPAGWESLLGTLWLSYLTTPNPGPNARYYGVVDDQVPVTGVQGIAWLPGSLTLGKHKFAAGRVDPRYGAWILVHEIAHTFGRLHPGCTGDEAQADPTWPASYGSTCNIGVSGADGHYGFDYQYQWAFAPDDRADFMTYSFLPGNGGLPVWSSAHTYRGLFDALRLTASQVSAASAPSPQGFLAVRGAIDLAANTASFDTAYRFTETNLEYAVDSGPYRLVLEGSGGQPLVSHAFDLRNPHLAEGATSAGFAELLPFDAAAVRLVLRTDDRVLATRGVTAHSPTVTLIYPNGGETLAGPITVRWSASDADGDSLSQIVHFSCDDGASWQALAVDVAGSSYQVQTDDLPGGQQCRFRVLASDGIRTGQDQSDQPFTVSRRAPSAVIGGPADGSTPPAGEPVTLWGAGSDPEDGPLGDAALEWRDSVTGLLGSGGQIDLANGLTSGWHTITLVATDTDGMTGTDQIRICVGCAGSGLSLTKSAEPNPAILGQPVTYTLVLANAGPAGATGVVLTDTLPAEVTQGAVAISQGTCQAGAGAVVCDVGAVAAGEIVTATVVVTPNRLGPVVNRAIVGGNEADLSFDNTATVTREVWSAIRNYLPQMRR